MKESGSRFLYQGGSGEIEEKKSRFIAELSCASSEEEASAFIASKKKQYYDARHNCHAYVIGKGAEIRHCSDDGEPGGTAGRPMLEVLLAEGLTDVVAVVTRYFGGTLLGTGGLIRAYQGAVKEALAHCVIGERIPGFELSASFAYTKLGKIQHILSDLNVPILDTLYTDSVTLKALVRSEQKDALTKKLTDATSGNAALSFSDPTEFLFADGKITGKC